MDFTQPGVYKMSSDGETMIETPYYGCSDGINFSDDIVITNQSISNSILSYSTESMRYGDYKLFSDLLSVEASRADSNSNLILKCYDMNDLDDELVYKISSLYDINYPLDYDVDKLKLLFKNYEKIRKRRGDRTSIYMLLRLIDRTETELYEDDSDDTKIEKISDGYYNITNSRIVSTEFTKYMLSKIIRTGVKFTFNGT